jgi:hypothetical protein
MLTVPDSPKLTVTSSRLNEDDYNYFKENFDVIGANVTSLEEADNILLGESHDETIDRIKNCWLLNKITSDNDPVYVEGYFHDLKINNDIFKRKYYYPIFHNVRFKVWDCQETMKNFLIFYNDHFAPFCKSLIEKIEQFEKQKKYSFLTDEQKIEMIETINAFCSNSEKAIREEINQIHAEKIKLPINFVFNKKYDILESREENHTPEKVNLLTRISILLNRINILTSLSKNASGEKLDDLLFLAIPTIAQFLNLWLRLQIMGMNFLKRQVCFNKNALQEKGKFHSISGKQHLLANDILTETLKKKKSIILFPNENKKELDRALHFLVDENPANNIENSIPNTSKKIKKFMIPFFMVLSVLALITHVFFYNVPEEFVVLSIMLLTTYLFKNWHKEYLKLFTSHKRPTTIDLYKIFAKRFSNDQFPKILTNLYNLEDRFKKQIKENKSPILEDVMSEIKSKYTGIEKEFKALKEPDPTKKLNAKTQRCKEISV